MKCVLTSMLLLFLLVGDICSQQNNRETSSPAALNISHSENFVLKKYIPGTTQLKDVTSEVRSKALLELSTEDRFIQLNIDAIDDSLVYFQRIEGFDEVWFRYHNGPIHLGNLPEGRYTLSIALQDEDLNYHVVYHIPLLVKGGLFYGTRGYLIVFSVVAIVLAVLLWIRSIFLRRDRARTVGFLENTVQRRTTQLQQLLSQRELLLKEIHHRVKNNLQVISALLEMQGARTTDVNVKAAITEGQNRVLSIAFIHQNLYEHDDLKGVEIGTFLKELVAHIRQVFERPDCPVSVSNDIPQMHIDIDSAIPLGLIINELLTNSYKYAFAGKRTGGIEIAIRELGNGTFHFRYYDNGIGLPKDFDFTKSNTLGMKLVRQLSRQLAGNILYTYKEGSNFEFTFKDLEARSAMV